MSAPLNLRADYDGPKLRALVSKTRGYINRRRLLAIATIYEGGSRSEAAAVGGVGLQAIRSWVMRFNSAGPDGLQNSYALVAEQADDPMPMTDHTDDRIEAIRAGRRWSSRSGLRNPGVEGAIGARVGTSIDDRPNGRIRAAIQRDRI